MLKIIPFVEENDKQTVCDKLVSHFSMERI